MMIIMMTQTGVKGEKLLQLEYAVHQQSATQQYCIGKRAE